MSTIAADRLRQIFAGCHPALAAEEQVALTLRAVGGLGTGEIARAFLVSEATMEQRLARAEQKIRQAGISGQEDHEPSPMTWIRHHDNYPA